MSSADIEALLTTAHRQSLPSWAFDAHRPAFLRRRAAELLSSEYVEAWPPSHTTRAVATRRHVHVEALSPSVQKLHLIADATDDDAMSALHEMVHALIPPSPTTPVVCELPWSLRALTPTLLDHGLGIEGIVLLGDVKRGREILAQTTAPRPAPALHIRAFHPDDVDPLLAIRARVFDRHDNEWGWLVHSAAEREARRQRWMGETTSGAVLCEPSGNIVGYLIALPKNSDELRRVAGMEIGLLPEYRGQGWSRSLWLHVLTALGTRGTRFYRGVSAAPSVLHLAQHTEREPLRIQFRSGARFDETRFAPWFPLTP